jgi:hypothetical protein
MFDVNECYDFPIIGDIYFARGGLNAFVADNWYW